MCQISRSLSIVLTTLITASIFCTLPTITLAAQTVNDTRTCLKCHKRNGQLHGVHASTALAIECQDCHGDKGSHPKKGSSINRFGANSPMSVTQQVTVCLSCHDPQTLANTEWTHNVHATRVSCTLCHQLHPEYDPMLSLDSKQHSQLCVTCHQVKH
ncbi:cytochrome c3 family protein [Shewanella colwelliana]|uniref:cytochrome c3 family protein n=1 Tax=Shewanella colwelliana TaxID=23 RepID=UPI00299DFA6E|nr:cytochrome c3 family protein [Shewanella colwelliana]MDX1279609.1 cytochrome c3 family protein [Shewanella colwelliana]